MPGDTGGESLQKTPGPANSRQHELPSKSWMHEHGDGEMKVEQKVIQRNAGIWLSHEKEHSDVCLSKYEHT